MLRQFALAGLAFALAGCVSISDGSDFHTPSTAEEQRAFYKYQPQVTRVMTRLRAGSYDLCPTDMKWCELKVNINASGGIGAVGIAGTVYVSLPLLDFIGSSDDELAVVLGHEWAHILLRHSGKERRLGQELAADCVGSMLAQRGGYDPLAGAKFYLRLSSAEMKTRLAYLAVGMLLDSSDVDPAVRYSRISSALGRVQAYKQDGLTLPLPAIKDACGV
jgi:hypothetical protein